GVWADGQLLVWGGTGPGYLGDGGRYVPTDLDGDGDSVCAGDCNDLDPTVAPSLPELCDGLDNNCDGTADEGNPGTGQHCSTGSAGLCGAGLTQCSNGTLSCIPTVTPVGLDTDGDGVDNACDNCPNLASSNLGDMDGDGTGDPCDFTLFAPGDSTHYSGKVPPASFSWGGGGFQQFLVE